MLENDRRSETLLDTCFLQTRSDRDDRRDRAAEHDGNDRTPEFFAVVQDAEKNRRSKQEQEPYATRDEKGEGDAESTRIYGQAYSKNPKLYKLLRTLDSYKKVIDDKTTAILSSDSELLKVLTRGQNGVQ